MVCLAFRMLIPVLVVAALLSLEAGSLSAQERGDHFFENDTVRDMFSSEQAPSVYGENAEEKKDEDGQQVTDEAPTPEPVPTYQNRNGNGYNDQRRRVIRGPGEF